MSIEAPLANGLAVIHSNQLESLRSLVVAWIQAHPLAPLENEIVLVQSNGMSQWLKIALAEADGLGICAAIAPQLPGRFLWGAYQSVLSKDDVPDVSPFEKQAMAWRLFRLLPGLLADARFVALREFLDDDTDARKRHQLAECLADLLDQYQVYRADWLRDWAEGLDQLRDAHGAAKPLPPEHVWQAEIWRAILRDVPEEHRGTSRALLHERFIAALEEATVRPPRLPRRVIVFGISSLPQQMVKALAGLAKFCQILLCVHNPCQFYWADIIEHKELLRAERRRQQHKPLMPKDLKDEDLHLHANPLLAAWGKQGRDYVRLLDEFDEPENYRAWFQRIDLFDDFGEAGRRSLLQQVQQAILQLAPLPANPDDRPAASADGSVLFQIAHSPQREVEILHDHLLDLFAQRQQAGQPLQPRDIIVMVPDIDTYAPHISAVFGQIDFTDPRYIPYSLTDQSERGHNPLMVAVEALLHLTESRFAVGDLMDLLDVPALRKRFAIGEDDLPMLRRWIEESGIRWGLHAGQRETLGLLPGLEQNSWRFGLCRMLLGYAVGGGEAYADIEPYDEIGGLDAALIGPLAALLDTLETHWRVLATSATPPVWVERLRQLLDDFFAPDSDREQLSLERLLESLGRFEEVCAEVDLDEALPITVVREAWLSGVDEPTLTQRFLAGRVNFCTLLPMRAIPFQIVCLMGMNDGDYPRTHMPWSFDLMAQAKAYRPGDRSRRDDDRYLFLEALLSAREQLYISWVGRSAQDNSERPPSLLVGQLFDYLAAGWTNPPLPQREGKEEDGGLALLRLLTVEHPLQAFSRRYFLPPQAEGHDARLFTHAREWRDAHNLPDRPATAELPPFVQTAPLTLDSLGLFLRHPVKAFFNTRLKVWFDMDTVASEDIEPFAFDRLQQFFLGNELLAAALSAEPGLEEARFAARQQRQIREGRLPLAGFADIAQQSYAQPAHAAYAQAANVLAQWPHPAGRPAEIALEFDDDGESLRLEDWLPGLRHNDDGECAQILVRPQAVLKKGMPKWHNLTRPWVSHLAGCAAGLQLYTVQVGPDGVVELPPLAPDEARACLAVLVQAWRGGMCRPLPLACKTAFAWLASNGDSDAARREYEGGYNTTGEVQQDAYLARAYPSFDSLVLASADNGFEAWLERLYAPLWRVVMH
ncbi:MAG: exodeoxyribonuclease V subunit gamma [Candidatus Methylumidiphilus sp.]